MNKLKIAKNWRDSATLILAARHEQNKFKLLMLKRSAESRFMPNAYVFPGGVSTECDFSKDWKSILQVQNEKKFQKHHRPYIYIDNDNKSLLPEIAFRICALRETFEESGILLVTDNNGTNHVFSDPNENIGGKYNTLKKWREKVNEEPNYFLDLFSSVKYLPDVTSLHEWSTWLTPTFMKTRFNTIFYVYFTANSVTNQSTDNFETTDSDWLIVDHMLGLYKTKKVVLQIPQIYESHRMNRYQTYDEFKQFAIEREKYGLDTWCPFKIKLKDGFAVTYPGDAYHNNNWNKEMDILDLSLQELNTEKTNRIEVNEKTNLMRLRNNIEWYGHQPLGDINWEVKKSDE